MNDLKIFSGRANPELTRQICDYLGLTVGGISINTFPDSEVCCKIDEDIRGRDVFLVQPTCPPVNEFLMELLIMIDSCKRASAERITAVMPYYGYARQDRKDEGRVPITAKLVADIITRAGADRVLAMDLHAAQIQGFFDVPVDHLYAAPVLNEYFLNMNFDPAQIVVVSPDEGSTKRALRHQERLGGSLAIVDKRRSNAETTRQENIIGADVERQDLPDVRRHDQHGRLDHRRGPGADRARRREIYVAATHGVLCGPAIERLKASTIKEVVITDSIPLRPDQALPKIKVLSAAPLLGEAIKRIHRNESVSRLFD